MPSLVRSFALLAWLVAGHLSFAAGAAEVDERQIVADVVAGRYDGLKSLEADAKRGDATAMHWWAALLDACAINTCRKEEAVGWWRKAAQAGNRRARVQAYVLFGSEATPRDPYVGLGPPRTAEERLAWAGSILGALGMDRSLEAQALATLQEVHDSAPTMLSMHVLLTWGLGDQTAAARAMLVAGTPFVDMVGETLQRQYLLRERKRYPELLAMARENDLPAALALCAAQNAFERFEMPADLYSICVKSFERGHLGLASRLLDFHMERQEIKAAARYALWCSSLPITCGESMSEFERLQLGDSKAWRDRDAELAVAAGIPATNDMPLPVRRRALSMKVRRIEAQLACMRRAYLPERGSFADAPECPWGKPPT